ncbi:MAG: 2OG-Fe(II) oxygenase [Marinobacter sp.]|nr:2OG-Fe(II) oxygenase [Marinobacter sp.]
MDLKVTGLVVEPEEAVLAAPRTAEPLTAEQVDRLCEDLASQGWTVVDARQALGDELLAALRDEALRLREADAMQRAGVGRGTELILDRGIRRDQIAWLEGNSATQVALFSWLEALRQSLNYHLYVGLRRFEAHYAVYEPGDFYRCHIDSFRGRASRVISVVIYLNPGWQQDQGGELVIYDRHQPEQALTCLSPTAGTMALFLSEEVPHEVLPASAVRLSIACWFRQDEVPLPL